MERGIYGKLSGNWEMQSQLYGDQRGFIRLDFVPLILYDERFGRFCYDEKCTITV